MAIIHTDRAPAAVGPYSQAIRAGNLPEGVEAQTEQSLKNVDAILAEAGLARTDVIKTTVFIRNMGDFAAVNRIYAAYFGDHKPARSCVEVSALPKNGLVEIEVIAVKE